MKVVRAPIVEEFYQLVLKVDHAFVSHTKNAKPTLAQFQEYAASLDDLRIKLADITKRFESVDLANEDIRLVGELAMHIFNLEVSLRKDCMTIIEHIKPQKLLARG